MSLFWGGLRASVIRFIVIAAMLALALATHELVIVAGGLFALATLDLGIKSFHAVLGR